MATQRSASKISSESADSVMSAFDLFGTPHTHTSVIKGDWVQVAPLRDTETGMLEFDVPGSSGLTWTSLTLILV